MFALEQSDGTVVISATDLTVALTCEYALLRRADEVLERAPRLETSDPMRERAAALGDLHEERVLDRYRAAFGDGVVEIAPVEEWTREALQRQHDATIAALAAGAPVVAQGGFFDGRFHGRADFLVREDAGQGGVEGGLEGRPRYAVVDAKLARRPRGTAILQLAAYADQLQRAGVPLAASTHLHLGNDIVTDHSTHDSLAVLGEVRRRVDELVEEHAAADEPIAWGDDRITACGWCDYCHDGIEQARDVRLVWGLRAGTREVLRAAGLTTIDALADSRGPVQGLNPAALERYRTQARLQVQQERAEAAGITPALAAQVHSLAPLDALPAPDPGDLFFDFEGDPLWVDENRHEWGLEYLFGILESPVDPTDEGRYVTFWAHDRASEKQALIDFLAYLRERRAAHPGMHVYHYAFYEPAAMRTLAARHRVPREEVEEALTAFVDLYETVKRGVHVSQRSYSIKKLEPFYMGEHLRDADGVTDGGASVVAYAEAVRLRDAGDTEGWQQRLQALADYNRYDCESTLRLRDWLLELREGAHREDLQAAVAHAAAALGGEPVLELDQLEEPALLPEPERGVRLRENDVLARRVQARTQDNDDPALPLLAAALTYHRQEDEPFWKAHRARLGADAPDWTDERDVLDIHRAEAGPWEQGQTGRWRRRLVLEGRLGAGSSIDAGSEVFCVYRPPLPYGMRTRAGQVRATSYASLVSRGRSDAGLDVLEVRERLDQDVPPHSLLPMLVVPGAPPRTSTLVDAVSAVARGVLGDAEPVAGAALDLLRRTPPRQRSGRLPEAAGPSTADRASAVTAALLDSDDSYVAVQGPPGTGKTLLGADVVSRLVRDHGWRIGIVAQSHAVVEQMLMRVLAAGVPADLVAKRGGAGGTWRTLSGARQLDFVNGSTGGCVLGGTTWDFANRNRVPAGALDLLVVEEAGQYALANTIAAATAARRLLLLGDPQQLPQVSQGRHAAPVDASALGSLMAGADVLPAELGYFLDRTWRMHPDLCLAVSDLSYEGRLRSAEPAAARHLEGVEPGVHEILVEHRGNHARSVEEAAEVVAQIEALLGRTWTDEQGRRPLAASDVIVVAAYNAQVHTIRERLDLAGLTGVQVGTVDRFQGQEAVVAVLSLAASTAKDAARGLGFLLDRNRINVALSRGRWAALIVRSPALTRTMPTSARELADLAAFIEVGRRGQRAHVRASSARASASSIPA
ncbi:TM0106 family RecB-like putative nuclease [Pseudactinotalea suaedae]|uniref:TM0106 family RecB-like putative nuclease n=1 Tax=Pseudactinotalea suaedae TaxID=1524924 RepID=UPI0012E3245E|nr:TM0106 family RecB-like putative nuclease [Pseudactinotalea suaedae]